MQLTFLGVSYTPVTSKIETITTETELFFRGHRCKMRIAQVVPGASTNTHLTYRGIHYVI
jgi:Domain of unknown function (DUF4278)